MFLAAAHFGFAFRKAIDSVRQASSKPGSIPLNGYKCNTEGAGYVVSAQSPVKSPTKAIVRGLLNGL